MAPSMARCSDGFEIGCDDGEKVRVAFALDCCDREALGYVATLGSHRVATDTPLLPHQLKRLARRA